MKQQLLRDAALEPTPERLAECLQTAYNAYEKFIEMLETQDVSVSWRYYGDGKAWLGKGLYQWITSRGTQKEANLFWLSIWDGLFKVTFYLPEKKREAALALPLAADIKDMIKESKPIGKLKIFPLTFDLCSDEPFDEIFTLIRFKKAP